jgi:iron complex outermembrane recepter protein
VLVRADRRIALTVACLLGVPCTGQAQHVTVVQVVDATTARPVHAALVRLIEPDRTRLTDSAGMARFDRVPARVVQVTVRRLGYRPLSQRLRIASDTTVTMTLTPSALSLDGVVVSAIAGTPPLQPTTVLEGAALDRALSTSIAGTLAGEAGITQRTNGPVATAPVIRGLSGDRVLLLEDGLRMGDVASTAPDHAITADPAAVRRIEVIRGPAGLLYGSNTLGGVVNLIRDAVPSTRPERPSGTVTLFGESVTTGGALHAGLLAPLGPLTVRLAAGGRTASNSRTPNGTLPFTDQQQQEVSAGASWIGARGHIGASVRHFSSDYGVPTSLGDLTLPGAHTGGIYIALDRTTSSVDAAYRPARGPIQEVVARGNWVRFAQDEVERGGFVGTRFGQLSSQGDVVLRYRRTRGVRGQGAVGAFGQWRDLRALGSFTGTRPAVLTAGSLFGHDEIQLGRARLSAGLRYDAVAIRPLERTPTQLLPDVTDRQFGSWTSTVAATVDVAPDLVVGTSLATAFRAPAIEELYSAGPHLASFAYEIGNPTLGAERGRGVDVFVRMTKRRVTGEASAFATDIRNFIYYAPLLDAQTGLPMRDPRLRRYVVYQATQAPALLRGAEGRLQVEPSPGWAADATVSWIRGTQRNTAAPLPAMPPLRARIVVRRESPRWLASLGTDIIGAQRRVPSAPTGVTTTCVVSRGDENEAVVLPAEFCPTDGVVLWNGSLGARRVFAGRLHAVTLSLENGGNAVWRDHLWRAKQVAPQAARNVRVVYRVEF